MPIIISSYVSLKVKTIKDNNTTVDTMIWQWVLMVPIKILYTVNCGWKSAELELVLAMHLIDMHFQVKQPP